MRAPLPLTGGPGYPGSVLCEHLLDAGFRVTRIAPLIYGQDSLSPFHSNPLFEFSDSGFWTRVLPQISDSQKGDDHDP